MESRLPNRRVRDVGDREGQTRTQSGSKEQGNHKVERPEHQRKRQAREKPVMCMSHQKRYLTVHGQHGQEVYQDKNDIVVLISKSGNEKI